MSTGGEGGMLLCNDDAVWRAAWSYKDHGKDFDVTSQAGNGVSYNWPHTSIGSNFRMTEMQAAIGRIQLGKLDGWLTRRRRNAAILREALMDIPACRMPVCPGGLEHAYYKCYVFVNREALKPGWSRDRIALLLREQGIACGSGACPELYRERAFQGMPGLPEQGLPVACRLGEESLMLDVHPGLDDDAMERIAGRVREVLEQASIRRKPRRS